MRRLLRGPTADRLIRWAALPITDRRWAAPLSAVALGFGLFVGVAIGPGAAGTFATGATQVIEIPSFGGSAGEEAGTGGGGLATAGARHEAPGEAEALASESSLEAQPISTPPEWGESRIREPAPAPDEGEAPAEPAPQDEAPQLAGTVVHVNKAAGSYTVAEEGGIMSAVHAGKPPAAGTEVEVPIESLANGTLAEAGKRIRLGEAKSATLAGIVTFVGVDPAAPAYTVSNRGVSVLVHVHPDPAGAAPALPVLGAYATVVAEIENSALWQQQVTAAAVPFTHCDLAGIVAAVNPETAQLSISADDVRASGQDLLLAVPPTIDVSKVAVGESVLASADIGADGALTLTGLAGDEHSKGADDEAAAQGDLVPTKPKEGASR